MSVSMKGNKRDFWSGIRHTIVPAIAGGALLLVQAFDAAMLNLSPVGQAIAIAAISGIGRYLQRFLTKIPDAQEVPSKAKN